MRDIKYDALRYNESLELQDLQGLGVEEFFSKVIPVKVYHRGYFELFITKAEIKNFGVIYPIYEIFYSRTKNGVMINEKDKGDVCCNQPNLFALVAGILNNHNLLGVIMSSGIQKSSDRVQKDPKF